MNLARFRKHQLKTLQHRVCDELRRRYARNRPPLYGQLNKGFTDEELRVFLAQVRKPVARQIFELMADFGLSITEACRLRKDDIDLEHRRLWVRSAKGRNSTMFYLSEHHLTALRGWCANADAGSAYLFPRTSGRNKQPYASPNAFRREFRTAVKACGLDFTYAESCESYAGRKQRKLHRLTTHSLRHHFITRIHTHCKDLLVTQKLARHKNVRNTQRYVFTDQLELDKVMMLAQR